MRGKIVDLTGMRFGNLTVLGLSKKRDRRNLILWDCKCDCGNMVSYRGGKLRATDSKSRRVSCGCRCPFPLSNGVSEVTAKYGSPFNRLRSEYIFNAERRGYVWRLTDEQFYNLVIDDCFYCGSEPVLSSHSIATIKFYANGVDRLDSSEGYFIDNCVPCCPDCNYFKNKFPYDKFISLITKIYEHHVSIQQAAR